MTLFYLSFICGKKVHSLRRTSQTISVPLTPATARALKIILTSILTIQNCAQTSVFYLRRKPTGLGTVSVVLVVVLVVVGLLLISETTRFMAIWSKQKL